MTEYPTSPRSPGSPKGVLRVTRYQLKKGKPNPYQECKVKCSMCNKILDTKDQLYDHHKSTHNTITCGVTEQSLGKHGYMHATKSYKCEHCIQYFTFLNELNVHMVMHESTPQFSCNIVGCSRSYFRKSELTGHDRKLWKCKHKGCSYEAMDKRYSCVISGF